MTQLEKQSQEATEQLCSWVEKRNWAGFDPYDGLNSPVLRLLSLGIKYPRIAAIQFMKKSPINLRPLLLVKPGHNPKGLGLFLGSYAKLFKATGDEQYRERAKEVLQLLKKNVSQGYSGNCWGYNFDWQSRAFFVPKYTPTIVNTSFIAHALFEAYEYLGLDEALDLALPIRQFLLKDLNRTQDGNLFCFSYTPIDSIAVHNASLLGASVLIRLQGYEPDDESYEAAHSSLAYSMKYQRDDGSWWYAEPEYQHWIDSFHTGFNLQSIQHFIDRGEALDHQEGYEEGIKYYAENFFLEDGTPKYFHDKTFPVDVHSHAQAIVFFSRQGNKYEELVERVLRNLLTTMRDPKGYFYFQRYENRTNKIPYMRWTQSWVLHALSEFALSRSQRAS